MFSNYPFSHSSLTFRQLFDRTSACLYLMDTSLPNPLIHPPSLHRLASRSTFTADYYHSYAYATMSIYVAFQHLLAYHPTHRLRTPFSCNLHTSLIIRLGPPQSPLTLPHLSLLSLYSRHPLRHTSLVLFRARDFVCFSALSVLLSDFLTFSLEFCVPVYISKSFLLLKL